MPIEENGKDSLQDALKQLLSADPEESIAPASEKEEREAPAEPASSGQEELAPQPPEAARPPRPLEPVYEVEIVPPEASPGLKAAEATPRAQGESAGAGQPSASQRTVVILDGAVEIVVRPSVSLARVAEFEYALRQSANVQWLGTFGKAKQGTTVKIQLLNPTSAESLFAGAAAVEKADLVKAGGGWRANVTLPEAPPPTSVAEEAAAAESPHQPAAVPVVQQPPEAVKPAGEPERPAMEQQESFALQREIDVEASPVTSLDDLNRLEKLLTSLAPGCRIVNVLSLDGVSTVLITLEGIDRSVLTAKLPQKVGGVGLDTTHKRVVVKLPEKW